MKHFSKILYVSVGILAFTFTISQAHADGGDGFKQVFKAFFGSEGARDRSVTCDMSDSDSGEGLLEVGNSFFCHMEKDLGITGLNAGVTKIFGTKSVRAMVTAGPFTVNSISYANQAQVWVCNSNCTSASSFNRAINVYFSYDASKTINKGDMLFDTGAFDSSFGQNGLHLVYDVGSLTSTQTISAQAVYMHEGIAQKMRMDSTKTGNLLGLSGVMIAGASASSTNSFRFAAQLDVVLNTGGVYFEAPATSNSIGIGVAALNLSTANDNKSASSECFNRKSDEGDDWNYVATGLMGCSVMTFASDSATAVGNYTVTTVLTGGSLWNGMAANPNAI